MTAAAVLVLSGCQDFLTRAPKLDQSDVLTVSTFEGLDNIVSGNYSYLSETSWYGQSWVIDSEMRSGNGIKDMTRETGRCVAAYTWNYTPDNTSSMWPICYYTVAAANNVIDNLEGKATDGVTEQDLNNLKAECLFMRAFAHFCVDNGADVVFGHGPHVVRCVELYKDRFIAYSLGNFCTPYGISIMGKSGYAPVIEVSTDRQGRFRSGRIHSFIQRKGDGPRRDTANLAAKEIRNLTRTDIKDSRLEIENDGAIKVK